ncbi:MAG: hypothetical protein LAP13_06360 [Acidobacteriia bacterium]|nr:hypothetical protein [Terriglobia bacterium]
MFTKIMKWVSIMALLLAFVWRPSTSYQVMLEILICVSALMVVAQAWRDGKYFWAAGFAAIAALFNPVMPVAISRNSFLWIDALCIVTFLVSMAVMKTHPRLSMPSITDRTPGSESL